MTAWRWFSRSVAGAQYSSGTARVGTPDLIASSTSGVVPIRWGSERPKASMGFMAAITSSRTALSSKSNGSLDIGPVDTRSVHVQQPRDLGHRHSCRLGLAYGDANTLVQLLLGHAMLAALLGQSAQPLLGNVHVTPQRHCRPSQVLS